MESFIQIETAWTVFLAACASIVAIGAAVAVIVKLYQWLRKPSRDNEQELEDFRTYLGSDKRRIEALESQQKETNEQNKLMLRGLVMLLGHEIDGNHTEQLIIVRDEIQEYLIAK
ncbi:MAG: phage coat protein [Atopobiaceae bacterium]|nr:phage coat protein [Atopobiaceae bacterium]